MRFAFCAAFPASDKLLPFAQSPLRETLRGNDRSSGSWRHEPGEIEWETLCGNGDLPFASESPAGDSEDRVLSLPFGAESPAGDSAMSRCSGSWGHEPGEIEWETLCGNGDLP
jgi:hypothetical protein